MVPPSISATLFFLSNFILFFFLERNSNQLQLQAPVTWVCPAGRSRAVRLVKPDGHPGKPDGLPVSTVLVEKPGGMLNHISAQWSEEPTNKIKDKTSECFVL